MEYFTKLLQIFFYLLNQNLFAQIDPILFHEAHRVLLLKSE